jgi:hypothetical protein
MILQHGFSKDIAIEYIKYIAIASLYHIPEPENVLTINLFNMAFVYLNF